MVLKEILNRISIYNGYALDEAPTQQGNDIKHKDIIRSSYRTNITQTKH